MPKVKKVITVRYTVEVDTVKKISDVQKEELK